MIKYKLPILIMMMMYSYASMAQDKSGFPYQLDKPSKTHLLPPELEEISGLTYYGPGQLAALNDEEGVVYVYDLNKKTIVERIRFERKGDFEGLELVGKDMYAIKSNGSLYKFSIEIDKKVEKISDPFKLENDIEGLGYNPTTHQLLIALKGKGGIEGVKVKGKAIYAYDLAAQSFIQQPVLVLSDKDLERVLGQDHDKKIRPSGIAVHPITAETYVLASNGRALIVFRPDGTPKNLSILKRKLFPQPEGITFSPQGELFISNEREGEGGTLHRFKMNRGN